MDAHRSRASCPELKAARTEVCATCGRPLSGPRSLRMTTPLVRRIVFFVARVSTTLVLLVGLAAISGSAQNAPEGPRISVSTRLVQVGVIARDKNGPVADLTKEDFVVLDRGKPQKISVFSVESSVFAAAPPLPLRQNTFSDLPGYGRSIPRSVTIVLLDNLNTLYGSAPTIFENTPHWMEDHALANAKAHLLEYLKNLGPEDRVALYGLSDTLHVLCDFTSDRSQLLAIVRNYDPQSRTSREVVDPAAIHLPDQPADGVPPPIDADRMNLAAVTNTSRAMTTLAALKAIAGHVANIPGRKNLVWLSANLPFSAEAMAAILSPAQIAAYPVDGRGLLPRNSLTQENDTPLGGLGLPKQMQETSGSGEFGEPPGIHTMQRLAELTGGRAFINSNDLTGAIRDAVDDAVVLYSLGFYVDAHSADGKFHELKVQVRREGLNIRYPKGYLAAEDAPPTKDQNWKTLVTAVQSPIESSVIPLEAKVERVNQPLPDSLSVLCSIDIRNLRLVETGDLRKGAISVYVLQQDGTGKVLSQWSKTYDLLLSEKQYAALLKSGMPFSQDVQPKTGVTTLRVLVEDPATAEVGSLIIPLSEIKQ
jgi:VWFA-related protein